MGEVFIHPFLGATTVCEVYLKITRIDIPDNYYNRKDMVEWVRRLINLPDNKPSYAREYKVEEVQIDSALVVS